MARTDYVRQLATAYSALRGLENDPVIFDAEFTALISAITAKVDIGDTATQTLSGELDVQAGGVTVQAAAIGSQARRASEIDTSLALKANLASPTFTGNVVVPVGNAATEATQKTYVDTALSLKANLASPTFTGIVTCPTQWAGSNSTRAATTAFVTTAVSAQHTRTWAASTAIGTNTSNGDAELAVVYNPSVASAMTVVVGGVVIMTVSSSSATASFSVTVPKGQTWSITGTNTPVITVKKLS